MIAFHVLWKSGRQITLEIEEDAIFETKPYKINVNGIFYAESKRMIYTVTGLNPGTEYQIELERGKEKTSQNIVTDKEKITLNVQNFGAHGDGKREDTQAIQAAILCCPPGGRVFIPEGNYPVTNLFLKSDITLELEKNARVLGIYDRERIAVLPGEILFEESDESYNLGSWEGDPFDSFASLITGISVNNVTICGEGILDGRAGFDNWWDNVKMKKIAWRPRMIFLNHCENIVIQGITVQNSPAWNIHPYFCRNVRILDMQILGPANSHNTDGCDPESCSNVEIAGVRFSVGDDCIAVKSGKIEMGRRYKTPSEHIYIRQSLMQNGHGAVTVGSEIAAGVKDLRVSNCRFVGTDRGLRVKTRRGRGKDSVLDDIHFENIKMENVRAPFVVNSFYFCDPDGRSEYVGSKKALPVDGRTPSIKRLVFRNIECEDAHFCGVYIYGLPEQKIEEVDLQNIKISFAKEAMSGIAAMMEGCEESCRQGFVLANIKKVNLESVSVTGYTGKLIDQENVDEIIKKPHI